ncbi:MAG: type II toxin-antitoxin system HicA family toxin [SAR202 cluster bacterium]|nr:type II toxin-antitoxin system HicA family toxin [SAR202 cluster bacterium]
MPRLPVLSGREIVVAFERAGWRVSRRAPGSHIVMNKSGARLNVSEPDHREVKVGTLRGLIRKAGMTVEEFLALL